jgi:hypothetical protein
MSPFAMGAMMVRLTGPTSRTSRDPALNCTVPAARGRESRRRAESAFEAEGHCEDAAKRRSVARALARRGGHDPQGGSFPGAQGPPPPCDGQVVRRGRQPATRCGSAEHRRCDLPLGLAARAAAPAARPVRAGGRSVVRGQSRRPPGPARRRAQAPCRAASAHLGSLARPWVQRSTAPPDALRGRPAPGGPCSAAWAPRGLSWVQIHLCNAAGPYNFRHLRGGSRSGRPRSG